VPLVLERLPPYPSVTKENGVLVLCVSVSVGLLGVECKAGRRDDGMRKTAAPSLASGDALPERHGLAHALGLSKVP